MQKSQLKASVHEQDSRNHGDINCLGKHSFQNKMIAPMKEGGGFRKVILFYITLVFLTLSALTLIILCLVMILEINLKHIVALLKNNRVVCIK